MKSVEMYFDYASPFSYIASELLERMLPGVTIIHRPIYLRGLEMFAKGPPYVGPKLSYLMVDLQRVAAHERVPLAPPAAFPIDGLQALRAAYVAQERGAFDRYHPLAFRATWAESRDIASKDVVVDLLARALDAPSDARAELAAAIAAQPIKDKLRSETERAVARGVFGAPTFFVGEDMFWGHDRMDYVARAASG